MTTQHVVALFIVAVSLGYAIGGYFGDEQLGTFIGFISAGIVTLIRRRERRRPRIVRWP
ncbi:MAG: hypothetical protein HYZ09_03500 [Candidatus Kerfeldbacteria bacterium]|nr:hypothetical protein [Candidatus Kerfeldbacteria bacterium]